jgi:hypothetical protein
LSETSAAQIARVRGAEPPGQGEILTTKRKLSWRPAEDGRQPFCEGIARAWNSSAGPAVSSITRGHLRKTLPSWSARAVTISWSCRALTQQIAGGSVIFGSVAEGIGNDQGACDGR